MKIKNIIDSTLAVSADDGEKVYLQIEENISKKRKVSVDFSGIEIMTTAFLNAAIGQLYSKFSGDDLNSYLKITSIEESDTNLLKKVIQRAKEYFADRDGFSGSASSVMYGA